MNTVTIKSNKVKAGKYQAGDLFVNDADIDVYILSIVNYKYTCINLPTGKSWDNCWSETVKEACDGLFFFKRNVEITIR